MKKISYLLAPLMALPFVVSCGNNGGGGNTTTYNVSIETNGVTISETKATKGKEYVAEISIDQTIVPDYYLPDTLTKVTSGNEDVLNYTYTVKENNLKADFKIPADEVVGNISIDLNIETPKVTAEEYHNAINNVGIEYLQFYQAMVMGGASPSNELYCEISPSVFHSKLISDNPESDYEHYTEKTGTSYHHKYINSDTWKEETRTYSTEEAADDDDLWSNPQLSSAREFYDDEYLPDDFGDVTYDSSKKCYYYIAVSKIDNEDGSGGLAIWFKNAKVNKVVRYLTMWDESMCLITSYEYEEIIPPDPHPDPILNYNI